MSSCRKIKISYHLEVVVLERLLCNFDRSIRSGFNIRQCRLLTQGAKGDRIPLRRDDANIDAGGDHRAVVAKALDREAEARVFDEVLVVLGGSGGGGLGGG